MLAAVDVQCNGDVLIPSLLFHLLAGILPQRCFLSSTIWLPRGAVHEGKAGQMPNSLLYQFSR